MRFEHNIHIATYDSVENFARLCSVQDEALMSGITFGNTAKGDVYSAKDILQGWYSIDEQMPDANIGAVRKNPGAPDKPLPAGVC